MKYFSDYYKSNFEELLTYYPRFYSEVLEMVEILKAFGFTLDEAEAAIERVFLNGFIYEADAETIKGWEEILNIENNPAFTLDQRKKVVISILRGFGHIGEQTIRDIIASFTDGAVEFDYLRGIIDITIDGELFSEMLVLNTLYKRIPAHLKIDMRVRITRQSRLHLDFDSKNIIYSKTFGDFAPQQEPRSSTVPLHLMDAGYIGTTITPSENTYYQTHIKSKLIKEE